MKCYLCENTDINCIHKGVRDNPSIDVLKCKKCGLVFLSSIEHISEEIYTDGGMLEKNVDISSYLAASQKDDFRRFEYIKDTVSNKKFLDFGCGAGGLLSLTKQLTKRNDGVELNKALSDYINSLGQNNQRCYHSIDDNIQDKYDIITLFHVLEHLPNPIEILKQLINTLLEDEGQIIIEVPNCDDALLKVYQSNPFADFTYWSFHLFLFSEATLELLVNKLGDNIKINYIKQVQRYPLSNHLYWLSKGLPGGHEKFVDWLNIPELNEQYENALASIHACDTIIMSISKIQN